MEGYSAKVYFDATPLAGAPETATWIELDIIGDATLGDDTEAVEITKRRHAGRKAYEPGQRDNEVTFDLALDPSDGGYAALKAAYESRGEIALAVMSGDITEGGIEGVAGNFIVSSWPRNEPIGAEVIRPIGVKPSSYMADYVVEITLDNAVTTITAPNDPLNLTGEGFGATEGFVYVTDNAVWGSEVKKNLCVVNTWAAEAIGALANMTGFAGGGETAYAWVVTVHGVVSSNSDSFVYQLL